MKKVRHFNINSVLVDNYEIRTETLNGIEHTVVPVIMMVEGVHNGSQGEILYTEEALAANPEAWNGVPVTVQHPRNDEGYISAQAPEVVAVGRVYNVHMHETQLRGEVWLNLEALKDQSESAVEHVQSQRALDVSIGAFMDEINETGNFNEEEYIGIASNLRPDHLALLPGGRGACSWDDGCGIRNNEEQTKLKGKGDPMKTEKKDVTVNEKPVNPRLEQIFTNETGYREIGMNIQSSLDAMDSSTKYHYLEELYDNHFIYRVQSRDTNTNGYYKASYTVNDDGDVEIMNDVVEVRRNVSFDVLEEQKLKFTRKKKVQMTRNKKPCEKVAALIANEATNFTEDSREWLEAQDEATLDLLAPVVLEEKPKDDKKDEDPPAPPAANATAEVTEEQIKKILNNVSDPEAWIEKFVPEGLGAQLKNGLRVNNEKRAELIEEITANSTFTKEKLEKWDTEDLQVMRDSVVPEQADYSLNGEHGNRNNGNSKISVAGRSMLNLPKKVEETAK